MKKILKKSWVKYLTIFLGSIFLVKVTEPLGLENLSVAVRVLIISISVFLLTLIYYISFKKDSHEN